MSDRDDSGRNRLAHNVFAGWLAHAVTIVIGFVMPRLILESVGPASLGVWDLGWSLVSYVALSGLGMAGAVTYLVARYRAEDDATQVRITTATGWYCQLALALAAGLLFLGLFEMLVLWMPGVDALAADEPWRIGLLLGLAIFVSLAGGAAQGILAGCHRGDLNEYVSIASEVVLAITMIVVLLLGAGIVGLAWATFATRLVFELLRFVLAWQVCPEAGIAARDFTLGRARALVRFGTKSSVAVAHDLVVQQGARILLALAAGPVALAVYSRYATIVRQIARVSERTAQVLPAMTSGLVGLGREGDVQRLFLRAANATVMLALPLVLVFGVLGDELVTVWMGAEFVVPGLSWVLAAMAFATADRSVASQVLTGLNAHGRIGLVCLLASVCVFLAAWLLLRPLDPLRAGVLVAVTLTAGHALPHWLLACRRIGVGPLGYLLKVYLRPLIANAWLLGWLLWADGRLDAGRYGPASFGAAFGFAGLAGLYWFFAFDDDLRDKVRRRLARGLAWATR
ncbi:MAG: oligosaccharide flippase family protein [Pseudomonadales bacterium]|nr:oligosaccharide flippase family protein [Pseudomonadales bacterium]